MWSSRLFLKLFLAYAGLILLTVAACSSIVAGWQEEQLIQQVQRRLRDSATLLRDSVDGQILTADREVLQQRVRRLGQQAQTRFTLVDATGRVLAESEQPTLAEVDAMDNHLGREEFVQAQSVGKGLSRRMSPTLSVPFLYYALSIERNDSIAGYVRAAEPIANILEEVASLRRLVWLAGLGVGLAGLIVTYWLTRRIVQPIRELTNAAEQMAAGNPPLRVGVHTNDEVAALATSFEKMVEQLGKREQILRQSVDRQSTILAGMNEGVLAVDEDQRVLFANSAAGNLLGFVPDQVDGLTLIKVVQSDDLRELVQRVLATDQLADLQLQWSTDELRTLDVRATPLPGDPCPGVVLVLLDITELNRLEGLRQQFVANVSHELKTPLSSIKAFTETLLNGALEDETKARHFLGRIDDQSDRLLELILDMLALARVESGTSPPELVEVSVSKVTAALAAEYLPRVKAAGVQLINELGSPGPSVRADEEGLRQIIDNLVDNALKYTPAGGRITLRCETNGTEAVLSVTDTGPGIDPAHHDRLFERFYRVDKARSRELGGTGLGLAIVKHLSESMGGTAQVESEIGAGSTFSVRLPLYLPAS